MKEVLLVIPAYNEEASIGTLLGQLVDAGITEYADVLVVNDASWDRTSRIAKDYPVTVISNLFNMGYGSALQLGYKYAVRQGYRYVLQMDADGQHDVSNIHNLYDRLREKDETGRCPDIVIGSRFLKYSRSFPISFLKLLAIRMFRWMVRSVCGQTILDPTSGLQGLNCRAFMYYSLFENFNPTYPDANMIIQMILLGLRVVEIPSVMHERKSGVSMHSGFFKPLTYMLMMPLSMFSIYVQVKKGLQKQMRITD
jgi:glycosyltransferase involved in cell wall biosynthesis